MAQQDNSMQNPIPFNPATMSVARVIEATEGLKGLFDLALRENMSDADIGTEVRSLLAHWQTRKS